MENPFKPDDKVFTKVKGNDVEATVRLVWQNEVQVRLSDGTLVWRTMKTVRPVEDTAQSEKSKPPTGAESTVAPVEEGPAEGIASASPEPPPSEETTVANHRTATDTQVEPAPSSTATNPLVPDQSQLQSCGVPQATVEARRKRNRH